LKAYFKELSAIEDGGVRLTAIGAELERECGELVRLVGIPRDLCPQGLEDRKHPVEGRLVKLFGYRPHDLDTAVHLVDVSGAGKSEVAEICRKEAQEWISDPVGPKHGFGAPG
jgi:hypothetical protein